jgi:hypothetical protein
MLFKMEKERGLGFFFSSTWWVFGCGLEGMGVKTNFKLVGI